MDDRDHEALEAEIHYWRSTAALMIQGVMREIGNSKTPDDIAALMVARLNPLVGSLRDAIDGDVFLGRCEPCGQHVKVGQLVVRYEDVGEVHAACVTDNPEHLKPGGRIPVDPEAVTLEEGEEMPEGGPALIVSEATDLMPPEEILRVLTEAEALQKAWTSEAADGEEDED
ncbi:hypothetical protein CPT_Sansa56 [Caulobacter phage Sansa]|uniref:Uncharacterized protein n=1 Tax=Caulobacter phage Sansa TaxID=1675600 RepID=A0A0K1LMW0_9CAUD|nr:hypothetical protein HOR07_gp056 [Caulobacter phage Sansa]AKU43460.1 hypothetical protein CPT_Sansa56 [Caulobacter phage Sansa]